MNKTQKPEVILFEEGNHKSGHLKRFLSFIRLNKVQGPPNFSFVDSEGSLISTLSLRENIALDSIPSTVSSTRTFTLEDHLKRLNNPYLWEFYQTIQLVDERPAQVDSKTQKTAALVKGLLQKADFLLLEGPEKYLDDQRFKIFIKALKYQITEHKQTLLFTSDNAHLWQPLITKTVVSHKCPKTGRISLETKNKVYVPFKDQMQQLKDKKDNQGLLVFNHPNKEIKITKEETYKKAS